VKIILHEIANPLLIQLSINIICIKRKWQLYMI